VITLPSNLWGCHACLRANCHLSCHLLIQNLWMSFLSYPLTSFLSFCLSFSLVIWAWLLVHRQTCLSRPRDHQSYHLHHHCHRLLCQSCPTICQYCVGIFVSQMRWIGSSIAIHLFSLDQFKHALPTSPSLLNVWACYRRCRRCLSRRMPHLNQQKQITQHHHKAKPWLCNSEFSNRFYRVHVWSVFCCLLVLFPSHTDPCTLVNQYALKIWPRVERYYRFGTIWWMGRSRECWTCTTSAFASPQIFPSWCPDLNVLSEGLVSLMFVRSPTTFYSN